MQGIRRAFVRGAALENFQEGSAGDKWPKEISVRDFVHLASHGKMLRALSNSSVNKALGAPSFAFLAKGGRAQMSILAVNRPVEAVLANCVDRNFVGFPPIPLKNAEWMGHKGQQ